MKVTTTTGQTRSELAVARRDGDSIGFVPTMGAFHEGHLGLIRSAKERDGFVVVSIFVNPLQFGQSEDFAGYPRDLPADLDAALAEGVDLVFAPAVEEMYPEGDDTLVTAGRLGEVCEGAHRPGHFTGVATVCTKLFNIVRPDRVYMGKKDAQQVAVIRQIVRDLQMPLEIVVCPTSREPDGLARSSRNRWLGPEDRPAAAVLSQALFAARALVREGERRSAAVLQTARKLVAEEPRIRLQYLEVVDSATFEPIALIDGFATLVVAAHLGSVRLIDNVDVGTGSPA
jgi:pantoate--beta-alanine ligase